MAVKKDAAFYRKQRLDDEKKAKGGDKKAKAELGKIESKRVAARGKSTPSKHVSAKPKSGGIATKGQTGILKGAMGAADRVYKAETGAVGKMARGALASTGRNYQSLGKAADSVYKGEQSMLSKVGGAMRNKPTQKKGQP